MNIIAICGSPRKGNTEFILKKILTVAEELGAKTDLILLREKRIEMCDGCFKCEESFSCHMRDDMQVIYPKLESNDLVILGSPTYFNGVTGTMKNFLDRLRPSIEGQKLNGKKFAVVAICQKSIKSCMKTIDYIEGFTNIGNMLFVGDLSLIANGPEEVENNPKNIESIDKFTKNLVS